MVPHSTPREALYIETGLLDIKAITDIKRINMKARLNRNKTDLVNDVLENSTPGGWMYVTNQPMQKYDISESDTVGR